MVSDPGFENSPGMGPSRGATMSGGVEVSFARLNTAPHSGSAAQSAVITSLGTGGALFEQSVSLAAGTVYQGSVWLRSPNGATVDFELRRRGPPFEAGGYERVNLSSVWKQITISGGFSANVSAYFEVNFDSIGTVVIDDASLRQVTESNCAALECLNPCVLPRHDCQQMGYL